MHDEAFRKAPFLNILFPLVGGIVMGRNIPAHDSWIFLGLGVGLLIFSLAGGRYDRVTFLVAFLCLGLVLGQDAPVPLIPEAVVSGRVCEEVHRQGNTTQTLIDRIRYLDNESWKKVKGKASLYLKTDSTETDLQPGTYILARGKLSAYPPPMNPYQFDYGRFQKGRGIAYRIYLDASECIRTEQKAFRGVRIRSLCFRTALIEKLESRIEGEDERAILNSLLLGYRKELSPLVKQNFARSGSMHILAVSGLHVSILYLLPALLLRRIRAYAKIFIPGNMLVFVGLWMYAFLTGLSPSVVRAVCMCCIHGLAQISKRRVSSLHVVSLAAFTMILASPAMVFEAGFQLSFAAVAGIICLYPWFMALFSFPGWLGSKISQMISVSLSAQLATMPLSICYFNQFSPASPLANLVVIPLASLILYAGLLFFLCGGSDPINAALALLLQWMSSFLEWFTRMLGSLPGACVDGLSLVPVQVLLLFTCGILLLLYLRSRSSRSLILLLSGVILFLFLTCAREYRILTHKKVYVFSLPAETAIGFVRGRQFVWLREPDLREKTDTIPYVLAEFFKRYKLEVVSGDAVFPWYHTIDFPGMEAIYIEYKQKRMLVVARLDDTMQDLPALMTRLNVSQVITGGSMHPDNLWLIERVCTKEDIRFHSTRRSGFFSY